MSAENLQQAPSFEVPPAHETSPTPEKQQEQGIEQGGTTKEGTPTAPAQATPAMPLPAPTTPPVATPQASTPPDLSKTAIASDMHAKDVDLIERQWVDSAKKIVTQTHEDPAKQKDQISQLSADYQNKRFNRKLKADNAEA